MYLFMACAGSLLLHRFFSSCGEQGLLSSCGSQASHCGGFFCCGPQASAVVTPGLQGTDSQAQSLWHTGLAALWHVGYSWIRDQTYIPHPGRQIPHHFPEPRGSPPARIFTLKVSYLFSVYYISYSVDDFFPIVVKTVTEISSKLLYHVSLMMLSFPLQM